MKIGKIEAFTLRARLARTFRFSQWSYSHRETTLVAVETDHGWRGWGEAYGPSTPIAAAVEDFFAPLLAGRDPCDQEELWHLMFARSLDYGQKGVMLAAISAIDIALWDIKARAAGVPLYRLLGASETEAIPCYATGFYFTDGSLEAQFEAEAERYLSLGFRAMKMKVGLGVERDAALVAHVRKSIGPEVRLMIDANHAYNPVAAIALGRRIEQHAIHWFEEPVSPLNLDGYLEVKRALTIPIAGGECEYTRFGFDPLLRRRAVDYAQVEVCACGGITEGIKIATLASLHDIHVTPHVWGTMIGQAAALHFYAARPRHPASLVPEEKFIECDQTENPLRAELGDNPIRFAAGQWYLPQSPGLGIEVNREAISRYQRAEA